MDNVHVLDHPLIAHKLAELRDKDTPFVAFKALIDEVCMLMVYEITRELPTKKITVTTPLEDSTERRLDLDQIIAVAILRAGMGMLEGVRRLMPDVKVGFLGYERDEETLEPRYYYSKVPPPSEKELVIVVDPMLATGGTAIAACTTLKEQGHRNIEFVALLGAPEGVKKFHDAHPDIRVTMAAMDRELNDIGYIMPGLGDAGDRIFGTED